MTQPFKKPVLCFKAHCPEMDEWTKHTHLMRIVRHKMMLGFKTTLWKYFQKVLVMVFDEFPLRRPCVFLQTAILSSLIS
jgi:hypothetical protein